MYVEVKTMLWMSLTYIVVTILLGNFFSSNCRRHTLSRVENFTHSIREAIWSGTPSEVGEVGDTGILKTQFNISNISDLWK